MQETLILIATAMIAGLMMSRLAKLANLPAVTAYLIAGLVIGPFALGLLKVPYLGFHTLESVGNYKLISQAALGFIAFTIGNEFRVSELKHMGKQAITVGILQAVLTTVIVDVALISLHFIAPHVISLSSSARLTRKAFCFLV